MISYFVNNDWEKHDDNVYEARNFVNINKRQELINYFKTQNSACGLHDHRHHTPNNEPTGDALFFSAECFSTDVRTTPSQQFRDLSLMIHQMNDAANRHTLQPMQLTKVVFHRYKKGSSGPEHADIYPLATLAYLNDDYEGGALFFPKQGIEVSPSSGSLLAFSGGTDYTHGVRKITDGDRYVLVAFWDYEDSSELSDFWQAENKKADEENNLINQRANYLKSIHPRANVLYPTTFPIVEIKEFIAPDEAQSLIQYMFENDIREDECLGPACFPEYYRLAYGEEPSPKLVEGVTETTLSDLNSKIKTFVSKVLSVDEKELKFSKFKGHNHREGAYSPPHGHQPAVAVAILALNSDYRGGEITIPAKDIEFSMDTYSLYIFPEGEAVKHGVNRITLGTRVTLVSHWQDIDNPYDKAGANV